MTRSWRLTFGLGWLAVLVGMAAVWSASRQLGLATWWLGPPASPRPLPVMVIPFVPPALLIAAAFNRSRHLPWWGLAGALVLALVGLGDLGRVRGFGLVELALAGAGAAVSLASLAGTYRR